jgi:hypothetical protein
MKTAIGVVVAVALAFAVVPAAGAGETFHAFSPLPAVERGRLTPLPDAHLATVEGGLVLVFRDINANIASIAQANVNTSAFSRVRQTNVAVVRQSIRD